MEISLIMTIEKKKGVVGNYNTYKELKHLIKNVANNKILEKISIKSLEKIKNYWSLFLSFLRIVEKIY